jgi:hypothetical protein
MDERFWQVPPDTFEKPGVQKVSLIERVTPAAP